MTKRNLIRLALYIVGFAMYLPLWVYGEMGTISYKPWPYAPLVWLLSVIGGGIVAYFGGKWLAESRDK